MQGDLDTARSEFLAASKKTCNGRPSIAGTLALARLSFGSGTYIKALALYRKALRDCPNCPSEVRLGIAACQLRLGEVTKAEAAYKRVLELDPGCTQALLALAAMELAVGASAEATQHGSRLLAQAFAEDPHNPHTLALLAHFSLQQGLAAPALRLAQAAVECADKDDRALRAEVTTLLARAYHANGALQDALQCYKQALELEPGQPSARVAKAQLDAMRGDLKGAVENLETLLDERPGWMDALRVLAPLVPRNYQGAAAVPSAVHFKEAAERDDKDASLWEMLGDVLAGSDPASALSAYNTAINLHRKASNAAATTSEEANGNGAGENGIKPAGAIPARLLNNAAVLQLRSGNPMAASQLVAESIASAQAGGLSELGPQAQVTLGYNAARVREAIGDLNAAEAEYKALLAQFPQYADCHLRLACIYKARGDIRSAEDWAQRAAEASGRSADALVLLAGLHLARRDLPAAKKYLEELQQSVTQMRLESYARVALANVHLYTIRGDPNEKEFKYRSEGYLTHALQQYKRVLEKDPGNIFAANGLGCVLAECGRLQEAKEVFLLVQEAAAGTDGFFRLPDAWVNLAGVYAGMKEYANAEQTYINAMRRFPEVRGDSRVQLYLAKAQYDGGRGEAALRTLSRTVFLSPRDLRIRFNLAYVLQQLGTSIIDKRRWNTGDGLKVRQLQIAMTRLRAAGEGFRALSAAGQEVTGVSSKKLENHIDFIAQKMAEGDGKLTHAIKEAEATATRMEANRARLESEAERRRLEEKRKVVEAEARQRAQEAQAKEAAAKLERLKAEWRQGAVLAKAAEEGDSSAVPKAGQQQQQQQQNELDLLFAEESDDEEYVPGQEDSAGGAPEGGGGAQLQGTAALAATGLLSSDEEDVDEDFDLPEDEDDDEDYEKEGGKKKKGKKGGKDGAKVAAVKGGKKEKKAGRLKKRGREAEAAAAEVVEKDDAVAKRQRQAAVLDDSDEEEMAPGVGDGDAPLADLFGSDSE